MFETDPIVALAAEAIIGRKSNFSGASLHATDSYSLVAIVSDQTEKNESRELQWAKEYVVTLKRHPSLWNQPNSLEVAFMSLGENAAFHVNEAPAIDKSLIQQDPTSEPPGENLG